MNVSGRYDVPAAFPPGKELSLPFGYEAELAPWSGLDSLAWWRIQKSFTCRESNPNRSPCRSHSFHLLSYPGFIAHDQVSLCYCQE
jgi:hypothetical protein